MATHTKGLWFVQLLEYGIGFAVASSATHSHKPVLLIFLALALIMNAASVRGPLSAFRLTGADLHRFIGIAVAVGILLCALFAPLSTGERLTLVIAAGAEAFVSVRFGNGI